MKSLFELFKTAVKLGFKGQSRIDLVLNPEALGVIKDLELFLLQQWIIDNHKMYPYPFPAPGGKKWEWVILFLDKPLGGGSFESIDSMDTETPLYDLYIEALQEGILKALEIIKTKQKK